MIRINGNSYINSKVEFIFKNSETFNVDEIDIKYWKTQRGKIEYFSEIKYGINEIEKIIRFNKNTDLLNIDRFEIRISYQNNNKDCIVILSNCCFVSYPDGEIIYAGITES